MIIKVYDYDILYESVPFDENENCISDSLGAREMSRTVAA